MTGRAEENAEIPEGMEALRLDAPSDTLDRFRKRASLVVGTRYVLERQFYGFWIVLNTMLKLLFKHTKVPLAAPEEHLSSRYRHSLNKSKEGRP
ncbi:hypothetical protein [Granulicella paludicola]|jgi:hypothetical protein|uniref:hypothetical protein n=1 Tax=Granulicella paludicola TaxID=474951 RepID=UPI0021E0CF84|nr:hypothetical protein [Granulicella paludicola]